MMAEIGTAVLKKQKKRKLPQIDLDTNNPKLRAFFKTISINLKLDQPKFMSALQQEFKEQSEEVFQIMKRFINFKQGGFDFRQYCEALRKFVSIDAQQSKDLFFVFLDKNKDKKVCETDLFNVIKSLESHETSNMILPDVMISLKHIEDLRKTLGKSDPREIRNNLIQENVNLAMQSNKQVERKPDAENVKQFLREVKTHQDRQRLELQLAANPLDMELAKRLEDMESENKEYVVPVAMRPFMNKEINFSLYVDLLSDKVDG